MIVVENRPTRDHFSKVSIHNLSGLKICKKRVYRNCKKNLPWEFWKVSWVGLFLTTFLSLENPWTFLLAKEKTWKRIFNTNSELLQNRTEKQIIPSKTKINWLFDDIWCYLFIACFDWKIGLFQQTVVRVYYILNILYRLSKIALVQYSYCTS